MATYSFLVFTKPVVGHDEEFNRWYNATHLPDMLKLQGFVEGQRFKILHAVPHLEQPTWEYVAIYSIETDDIRGSMAELNRKLGTDELPMSECIDSRNLHTFLAAPIEAVVKAPA